MEGKHQFTCIVNTAAPDVLSCLVLSSGSIIVPREISS